MKQLSQEVYKFRSIVYVTFLLLFLYIISLSNYLLFHSLAEIFSIVIALSIFMIIWNSKSFIENSYIIVIGTAYLFIGSLDMLHMLSYKNMGVFQGNNANLPTQLWIAARYMESMTLLIAPLLMIKRIKPMLLFNSYLAITICLLGSIFYWTLFPDCFVEGAGLTLFKKGSEYIISLILLCSLYLLFQKRQKFDLFIYKYFFLAIVLTIFAELAFTFYITVFDFSNLIGHMLKIISFYLVYKAIIYTGLKSPYSLMFKDISENERRYRQMFETNQAVKLIINPEDGSIVEANDAAVYFYGYSKKEITSLKISEINTMSPDEIASEMTHAKFENKLFFNFRHRLASGEIKEVEVYSGPIEFGQDTFLYSIVHDVTKRKQAEEELFKSEEKFRAAFLTSPDAINLNTLKEGRYIDLNDGFTKIMGYSREEVIGKSSVEINIWNDLNDRDRLVRELKKNGFAVNLEAVFKGKNGKTRVGLMSANLIRLENEDVILSITRDITEKKQSEDIIHENEKRYRQLVENIAELVWEVDTNVVYSYISPRTQDVYGRPPEFFIGRTPFEFMPAGEVEKMTGIFGKIIETKEPFIRLENIAKHRDGSLHYMEATGFPFFDNDLNLLGYRGTAIDITERKQNERDTQTLVESTAAVLGQELFNTVVVKLCKWLECDCAIIGEIVPDGMVKAIAMVMDGEHINNYSYDLIGSPCDETARNTYCEYSENVSALFPKDSDLIDMDAESYVGTSLEDKDGNVIGILCGISRSKMNITRRTRDVMKIISARVSAEIERKKIEEDKVKLESQLIQTQKVESIGVLAGGIAHDFNNILFPILGHSEMLLEDTPAEGPTRESINEILNAATRAKELVQQILSYSRHEKHDVKLMKLQPVIKEVLNLIRATIPSTIEIKQEIQSDCGIIKGDPTKVHQIIMNLATNAYHAMDQTGGDLNVVLRQVEIEASALIAPNMEPGPFACLTVADTGTGMSKEIADKIFDPFFTTKEQGKGTGMGLSVVLGIVNSMRGAIHVDSQPSKGTRFCVYLPIQNNSIEEKIGLQKEAITGNSERILLVDDEDSILTMEKSLLERLGYKVEPMNSSPKALDVFRAAPDKFDLVITDLTMPKLPGDKLAAELLKIKPDIPIILNTGFSDNMTPELADVIGIKSVLMKPIRKTELAETIHKVLKINSDSDSI